MKNIGYIGNTQISVGIILALGLIVDKDEKGTDYHIILPFIALSYNRAHKTKKNTYYDK